MRDPAARAAVTGIVTIDTPFLSARRRNLRPHADVIAWVILGVAALAAFVPLDTLREKAKRRKTSCNGR